jgi:hypothetical protein
MRGRQLGPAAFRSLSPTGKTVGQGPALTPWICSARR